MSSIDTKDLITYGVPALTFIGACGGFLINSIWKGKDENIKRLEREVEFYKQEHAREKSRLEQKLDEKERKISDLGKRIAELLEAIKEDYESRGISTTYLREVTRIFNDSTGSSMEDAKTAAKLVRSKSKKWLEESVAYANRECPEYLPDESFHDFKLDIGKYIEWLYESLESGYYLPRKNYIESHSLDSIFPYRAALRYLSEVNDFGQLTESEAAFIQNYTQQLYIKVAG